MELENQVLQKTSQSSVIGSKSPLDKQTFAKTMGVLSIHFPNLYKADNLQTLIPAMYAVLSDLTPKRLERGLKKFLMLHKEIYPNTNIAACIREYALLHDFPIAADGWLVVEKNVKKLNMHSTQELDEMDYITEEIVASMGIYYLRQSINHMADRAHFFKMFEQISNKEKQRILLGE